MNSKTAYIEFCSTNFVPLFFEPFWLDACEHSWDVSITEVQGYRAFWVFHLERKYGFTFIRNPHLTPYTGIVFEDNETPNEIRQQLATQLFSILPRVDVLEIDLHYDAGILLSKQEKMPSFKHTNLLLLDDKDLYEQCKPALKRQIKKAERILQIVQQNDIDLFYKLHSKSFEKRNQKPSVSLEVFRSYWQICEKKNCGKLFFSLDEKQHVHAALFLVYDQYNAYYLAGGTDAQYYGSGAMSHLMWHAIQHSIYLGKNFFDFEGSMIASIDRFFKNFTPLEKKYLHIEKINSVVYKMLKK